MRRSRAGSETCASFHDGCTCLVYDGVHTEVSLLNIFHSNPIFAAKQDFHNQAGELAVDGSMVFFFSSA